MTHKERALKRANKLKALIDNVKSTKAKAILERQYRKELERAGI